MTLQRNNLKSKEWSYRDKPTGLGYLIRINLLSKMVLNKNTGQ
jgi:hypothetical protein